MSSAPAAPVTPWDPAPFRDRIQETLTSFVDDQAARLAPLGADAERLVQEARTCVAGGKRFRAAFCYWGARAVAGPDLDETGLVRAAAALEVLHASALVHDDFMDASDTRRGRPATHVAFAAEHRERGWRGDPDQYGASAAILLGDLLLSWSDELLRHSGLDHDRVRDAMGWFDHTRSEVIAGQFLDVSVQARGAGPVAEAMTVLRYKSAKYSIERPLNIGAALAGAGSQLQQALSAYGLPLGEAFQLRDDLLGVFGDPGVTGKPAGDDLSEGKRTVLVALALELAGSEDAALLDKALGTPLDPEQVRVLQEVITRCGAAGEVEAMIADLTAQSLVALALAPVDEGARAVLTQLAEAATTRTV